MYARRLAASSAADGSAPRRPRVSLESSTPLVSIGMPVYNAAATLRRAIDSLLAQEYGHFELIVSDNASTDATGDICSELAARDPRIRYIRQDVNRGPAWNFNHVVELARGKYFMRMSHDDVRAPSYLTKCVALLEANPRAVLSHSHTAAFYGEIDNVACILTHDTVIDVRSPSRRFMRALRSLPASAIDGVFRTDVLRQKTRLLQPYLSSDVVLTHELTLHGEFVQVPEVLFWRSGKAVLPPPQDVQRWSGEAAPLSRLMLPAVVLLINHLRSIRRSPLGTCAKTALSLRVIGHECKVAFVKAAFRAATALAPGACPAWLLRTMIQQANDMSNRRLLQHPRDLPPAVHPMWPLLNHRDQPQAMRLQRTLEARLYR